LVKGDGSIVMPFEIHPFAKSIDAVSLGSLIIDALKSKYEAFPSVRIRWVSMDCDLPNIKNHLPKDMLLFCDTDHVAKVMRNALIDNNCVNETDSDDGVSCWGWGFGFRG
jgi:hypothetical protein